MKAIRLITASLTVLLAAACNINSSIDVPAGTRFEGASTVNGSITVGEKAEVTGELSTVNGGIRIGKGARTGDISTVNGEIEVAEAAVIAAAQTVNGSVELDRGARAEGDIGTVNGSVSLYPGSEVTGGVSAVNGGLKLRGATVLGGLSNVNGGMLVTEGSRVKGGLVVERPSGRLEGEPPRIVIGPDSVIEGRLRFERPVRLYIHETAQVGPIEGAEAIRYAGEEPPQD